MFTPDLLAGKTAIITGGGTGLGLAMATKFATLGANVVIASRSEEHLSSGAAAVAKVAPAARVLTIPMDVRKPEDVDRIFLVVGVEVSDDELAPDGVLTSGVGGEPLHERLGRGRAREVAVA